jgi:hypothetical protein
MIFFNLHLLHEYYPYSSAIFLLVDAGLLIADLLDLPGRRAWLGFALLVTLIATCLVRYHGGFYRIQQLNVPGRPGVAAIIDHTTKPDDVIVITGLGWSSELPHQSHRRSITDFSGSSPLFPDSVDPLAVAIRNQGPQTIPEIVVCNESRGTERAHTLLQLIGIAGSTTLHADNCDVYLRALH